MSISVVILFEASLVESYLNSAHLFHSKEKDFEFFL